MLVLYIPAGYYIDMTLWRRRERARIRAREQRPVSLDVEMLTVGPIAENCFLVRREGSDRVL